MQIVQIPAAFRRWFSVILHSNIITCVKNEEIYLFAIHRGGPFWRSFRRSPDPPEALGPRVPLEASEALEELVRLVRLVHLVRLEPVEPQEVVAPEAPLVVLGERVPRAPVETLDLLELLDPLE